MIILLRNRKPIEVDFDAQKIPLLRRMLDAAPWRLRWDCKLPRGNNFFGTQKDWNQTITTKINEISGQIHKATLRGGADTLIVSRAVLAILEDNEYVKTDEDGSIFFGSRYQIHVNKYLPSHAMIVCKMVADEEDWFKNPKLMGVVRVDSVGGDAEAELTAMLSNHIASEIDKEILNGLRKGLTKRSYLLIE